MLDRLLLLFFRTNDVRDLVGAQSRLRLRFGIQGGFEMPRLILYSGSPFFERSCLTFKCCRRTTAGYERLTAALLPLAREQLSPLCEVRLM